MEGSEVTFYTLTTLIVEPAQKLRREEMSLWNYNNGRS